MAQGNDAKGRRGAMGWRRTTGATDNGMVDGATGDGPDCRSGVAASRRSGVAQDDGAMGLHGATDDGRDDGWDGAQPRRHTRAMAAWHWHQDG